MLLGKLSILETSEDIIEWYQVLEHFCYSEYFLNNLSFKYMVIKYDPSNVFTKKIMPVRNHGGKPYTSENEFSKC